MSLVMGTLCFLPCMKARRRAVMSTSMPRISFIISFNLVGWAFVQKLRNTASAANAQDDVEGEWMSLKDLSALLKKHFKGYREEPDTFRKIGSYLNRPEYKFQSKRVTAGMLYWVKPRV